MPKVIFVVSEREKALWIEASHDERVSLSEWLRRAANARLGNGRLVAGEGVGSREPVVVESRTPASPASLATSRGGLGAADDNDDGTVTSPLRPASAAPRPHHRADPKDKASQEHGKKERTTAKGLCPHRIPVGSYCKRCEEAV